MRSSNRLRSRALLARDAACENSAQRLLELTEPLEQVTANARQQVVFTKTRFMSQGIDDLEGGSGPVGHRHRDGPVQGHDGRRLRLLESVV